MSGRVSSILIPLLVGCAPYVEVQSQLVDQTERGVAALQRSLEQKSQIVERHHAMQRQRLDDAFDADVSNRAGEQALDAQWVIEHRRAYAAAVDALSMARFASLRANETDARNAAAVRGALDRLRFLQSIQFRWMTLGREDARERD